MAGGTFIVLVAFAALVLWLRYAALPNVDSYRETIVASIERASGMAVQVRAMRAGWGGLRPVLSLEGVTITDRAGRAAFRLELAEVTLSWWSLLAGEVRFQDVDFHRPDLVLTRGADGLIYLADKPLNEAGPAGDAGFTQWLLAQPRLGIHDATLTWRDDFLGAPEVRLAGVEIAVARRLGRHRAALTATPSAGLARRIDLRADVTLSREGDAWKASGEAYAEALDADLAQLRDHLPVSETLRAGVGSARLWLKFSRSGLTEATGDINIRDARAQLVADALPLELASLAGRASYRVTPAGFTFATEGLQFRLPTGEEARPGNFSLSRTAQKDAPARVELRADGIDLKIAATLVDYFPVPRELKSQVQRFAPRGRIVGAQVAWSDDGAKSYSMQGRFEDLAVNAVEGSPGVSGLTGSIEGTEAGGQVRVDAKKVGFDSQRLFRAPLAFDGVQASARWTRVEGALHVAIEEASFANADLEGSVSGTWRSLPSAERKSPGYVDLRGRFSRGIVGRAAAYLPNAIARTRTYLESALQTGELASASWEVKGDMWEFPFGPGSQGRFVFEGDVRKAQLRYHPAWPSIDAIDGTVRFENRRMEIAAARALIFASRVQGAKAVVEDLGASPPVLMIDGDIDTTGADSVRFLRESPLVNGPGAFTRAVAIEGPARLKLHLEYPFSGTAPVRVAGDYQFAGATASVGRALALREVHGRLSFTERGVRAPELVGTMFDKPATLAMGTEPDGRVLTAIDGQVDAAALAAYLPGPIAARLSGSAPWKARVLSGAQGTEVSVSSDLKGLASSLPAPLAKAAGDARALAIELARMGTEGERVDATLEGGIHWRSRRVFERDAERWQVAVKAGAPFAGEPAQDGLWLYGAAPMLDADAWMAVFPATAPAAGDAPANAGTGFGLRGLDLALGRVRYLGREYERLAAKLERSGEQWNGTLESPRVAGSVEWNPRGKGRVIARLARLAVGEAVAGAEGQAPPAEPGEDPPALDVIAEQFHFRGRELGRLELRAEHEGEAWRIGKLDITNPHAQFRSTGSWRRTGTGSITTLDLKLDTANLNALMGQFGWGDYMKRGTGKLEGTLAWPGYPAEFATAILSGSFKVEAQRGQFAKLEPGAGKLLGLLSLQSLPRRAMFDFRDVFSDGFAFETIEGNVKLARGVLVTDDFQISGPSAFVSLAGEASLPRETQSLTLRVVPEVGEGMALAATVFGTPVLGLSALLMSKLLRNPLGKAVAYEYQVTGSWDNPVVTRTSAPPAPPAKAATAAEAKK